MRTAIIALAVIALFAAGVLAGHGLMVQIRQWAGEPRLAAGTMTRPVSPSCGPKGPDRQQCCWHVLYYRVCGVSAEVAVYAADEAGARSAPRLSIQLRRRGLRVQSAA